jgi:hypothetical protein
MDKEAFFHVFKTGEGGGIDVKFLGTDGSCLWTGGLKYKQHIQTHYCNCLNTFKAKMGGNGM